MMRSTGKTAVGTRRRPYVDPRKEAMMEILRAADRIWGRFTGVLEPYGLTPQQFNVLRILRGARPDPLPTMEIAERMIERTPGITGLLDRLEAKGWIARVRRSDDRRCVLCSITSAGLDLLERLDEPVDHADAASMARLDDAEVGRLLRLLAKLRGS